MEDLFKSNVGSSLRCKLICTFVLFVISLTAMAQEQKQSKSNQQKQEVEKQIDQTEVPSKIISLISPYAEQIKKVKYYRETDGNHESYEVKFYFNESKYSIEFSKEQALEDIEVDIDWKELDERLQSAICDYLSKSDKHKVDNIQKQFSSDDQDDEEIIQNVLTKFESQNIRYELIVELKNDGTWKPYELLFDDGGNLIQQRPITKRTSDFILY